MPTVRGGSALDPPELLIPDATPYEEWKRLRRGRLGASDIGAILAWAENWSAADRPYGSAISVAHRLAGLAEFDSKDPAWGVRAPAECGRLWEDGVWDMYCARTDVVDEGKPGTFLLAGSDIVVATPDRLVMDPTRPEGTRRGLCQIKIVFSTGAAKWKKDGEVCPPRHVLAQCQQEMGVMGRSWNDLVAVIDGCPHVWRLEHSPQLWASIQESTAAFLKVVEDESWGDLIDGTLDASSRVTESTFRGVNVEIVELEESWDEQLQKIETLKALKKQTEFEIREIETKLRYDLDGATIGRCEGWRVTCRSHERRTLDTLALKKESPETWKKHLKTSKTKGTIRITRRPDVANNQNPETT